MRPEAGAANTGGLCKCGGRSDHKQQFGLQFQLDVSDWLLVVTLIISFSIALVRA